MRVIEMPGEPGFTKFEFRLDRAVSVTSSPFTGQTRTQVFDRAMWAGSATLPPMLRDQAAAWQAFFLECVGPANVFLFGDVDAEEPTGAYAHSFFTADRRVRDDVEDWTADFDEPSANWITTNPWIIPASTVDRPYEDDYIEISGSGHDENNGRHKVAQVTGNRNRIRLDGPLEAGEETGVRIAQNVRGGTSLALSFPHISGAGGLTVKAGDYMTILDGDSTSDRPLQMVMVTADAEITEHKKLAVAVQPPLRADLDDGDVVGYRDGLNRAYFRLTDSSARWTTDHMRRYGFTFDFMEAF